MLQFNPYVQSSPFWCWTACAIAQIGDKVPLSILARSKVLLKHSPFPQLLHLPIWDQSLNDCLEFNSKFMIPFYISGLHFPDWDNYSVSFLYTWLKVDLWSIPYVRATLDAYIRWDTFRLDSFSHDVVPSFHRQQLCWRSWFSGDVPALYTDHLVCKGYHLTSFQ